MLEGLANIKLNTINIKGKEYVPVNERIKAFRQLIPDGMIGTEIVSINDGVCIVKATITDSEGKILATGHACEKQSDGYINKTSFIENCETSAVGRALGLLGIGIDVSVASSDEVSKANEEQELEKIRKEGQPQRIEAKKKVFSDKYDKTIDEVNDWLLGLGKVDDNDIERELDRWITKPTAPTPYERKKK